MCKKMHEIRHHIRKAIEGEGAVIVAHRISGGGHQAFDFLVGGRAGSYYFALTPRSARDPKAIATAKRVIRRVRGM